MPIFSRIDPSITYLETRKLRTADQGASLTVYPMELHGIPVRVIIGAEWNPSPAISAFPIYLINAERKGIQVGIFERPANNRRPITLADTASIAPLFFFFSTPEFIQRQIGTGPAPAPTPTPTAKRKSTPTPKIESTTAKTNKTRKKRDTVDEEETPRQARSIREKYHVRASDTWFQRYMKNRYYGIHEVESNGDCFFASIRDALATLGTHISVADMRAQVASAATEDIFQTYRELYDMYAARMKDISTESRAMKQTVDTYTQRMTSAGSDKDRAEYHEKISQTRTAYKLLRKEYELVRDNFASVKFMKPIQSLDDFRAFIQTPQFWADSWAIGVIERMQSVKAIIFSRAAYNAKDFEQVLRCNSADSEIEQRGIFQPRAYILLEYSGDHYRPISYRRRMAFTFSQLPYDVKQMITNKCMESPAGIFSLIPAFSDMKKKQQQQQQQHQTGGRRSTQPTALLHLPNEPTPMDLTSAQSGTQFVFYEGSEDAPAPGKGVGETIPRASELQYVELHAIPKWRKQLHDHWTQSPFEIDGYTWTSVTHYIEAAKCKQMAPDFYKQFAIESNTPLSKNPHMAIAATSKKGEYKYNIIRPPHVRVGIIDMPRTRRRALQAKFSSPEMRNLLQATAPAQLMQYHRGQPPTLDDDLMYTRTQLDHKQK